GDTFLPETLRRYLGMSSNQDRLGRDAYLLHALLASRRDPDSVHVLIARWAPSGSSLKPSRLLFQTRNDPLFLQRVHELIRNEPPATESPLPHASVQVSPPELPELPRTLSVTALRQFLTHPFDFYLRHVLKWNPYPLRK